MIGCCVDNRSSDGATGVDPPREWSALRRSLRPWLSSHPRRDLRVRVDIIAGALRPSSAQFWRGTGAGCMRKAKA
jgi:hypothetical protein